MQSLKMQTKILYPSEITFKIEGEPLSSKNSKEYIACQPILKEMLKEVIQVYVLDLDLPKEIKSSRIYK